MLVARCLHTAWEWHSYFSGSVPARPNSWLYLPFDLSHTAIICNSDDYWREKKDLHLSKTQCTLWLIKNRSQRVTGIHLDHCWVVICLTCGNLDLARGMKYRCFVLSRSSRYPCLRLMQVKKKNITLPTLYHPSCHAICPSILHIRCFIHACPYVFLSLVTWLPAD